MKLRIKRLTPTAILPKYQTDGAAGLDLHADLDGRDAISVLDCWTAISTGISVEIPKGYEGQVRGRSGLAFRHGVEFFLGTIDSDYRGEVKILLRSSAGLNIYRGDRIAQLVIAPVSRVEVVESDELTDTERGSCGFGSTGSR